jgi:hypothetical protein
MKKNPRKKAATARMVAANKARRKNTAKYGRKKGGAVEKIAKGAARNPVHRFQIATFRDGHVWFWEGNRWTANRSFAAVYGTIVGAKASAHGCGRKCAVVTQADTVHRIDSFFTGKA